MCDIENADKHKQKVCTKCNKAKSHLDFYKNKNICKQCWNKREYEYRANKLKKLSSQDKRKASIDISEIFELSDMKRKDFAKRLRTSDCVVDKLINGDMTEISIQMIENIINTFNCRIEDIIKIK